jgi:hypothetical protein
LHAIDDAMPGPRHHVALGWPVAAFIHAVGPRDKSGRGQHGFGVVVTGANGLGLCEFGYKSNSANTTGNRGQLGALLSAIVWREKFAPQSPLTVNTRLQYIYEHFAMRGKDWVRSGKKADGKEPENFDLLRRLFVRWQSDDAPAVIKRVAAEELPNIMRAEQIAKSMRDHGTPEFRRASDELDDFFVAHEDINELIARALYKDNRDEERKSARSLSV